jgi:hypothetical protein
MNIRNSKDLREAVRHGPYAWPGGYPCFFITSDGAALSFNTVKQEYRQILRAVREHSNCGWRVVAFDINWEDTQLYCDHTGEPIESAYGEPEAIII